MSTTVFLCWAIGGGTIFIVFVTMWMALIDERNEIKRLKKQIDSLRIPSPPPRKP